MFLKPQVIKVESGENEIRRGVEDTVERKIEKNILPTPQVLREKEMILQDHAPGGNRAL